MYWKSKTLAIVLSFLSLNMMAQSGSVKGSVYDNNKLPLPGAEVYIKSLSKGTVSDLNGNYVLTNIPTGQVTLSISYLGYTTQTRDLTIEAGKTAEVNFELEPGTNEIGEVILVGTFKKGQARALNVQKNNTNITNVVSSDQVGRFPDANIGEAMRRIPGIAMQNDQGEARDIIIRGMAPQLNSVMVNGERVPSAEGDNRRIQMDLIPADMIQTIEVNKSVTPDMDADAIGGSVNLVTRAAPSGRRISLTAASGYNFLSQKPIWTGAFVYGNRFASDKLGLVVSGSYNNHDFGSDNIEFEWSRDANDNPYISEMDIRKYEVQRIRRSVSANLDYKINSNNTIYLKSIYNWRDDWENRYRLRYQTEEDGNGGFVGEASRQTKGGINNDRVQNRRLEDQRMWTAALSGEHLAFSKLKIDWSASLAKASEERPNERYITYQTADVYPVTLDLVDPKFPSVVPVTPSLFDGPSMELDEITEEHQYTEELDNNYRLNFELPITQTGNYKNSLKFGGRYRSKSKKRDNNFYEYSPVSGLDAFSDAAQSDQTDSDYLAGSKYAIGNFVTSEFLGDLDLDNPALFDRESKVDEFAPANYEADENITAAYVMLTQDLGSKLSMIAGVRVENTAIDYTGNRYIDSTESVVPVTDEQNYTNVLPGLHFKYSHSPNTIFRLAYSQTLARPNYFDLVPFQEFITEDAELNLGNSNLKAAVSNNVDFMFEHYFKSIGLVSGGVFYKKISDFIYTSSYDSTISGTTYDVTRPRNGAEADVYGVEIAYQRNMNFIPGEFWKYMNIYLNYTFTESSAEGIQGREDGLSLEGTAGNMFNGSLSYEGKKLLVRASVNFASDYIDEYGGESFEDRYYDKQLFLDLNASYSIKPYLRVFVEAINLTNQPLRYYQGISDRSMQVEYYNSRVNLGVKLDL